nr:retrovirus-related Pol polyprotein from transposon opus isoform X2 [Nothobranchius furzeri]
MELDHELQMLRENTSTSGVEARSADTLQTDSPPDADRREVEPPADERNPDATERRKFDVGKCIALVPTFRETEVDSFFSAFERLAAALDWPREVWSLVLQCKLSGKAQVVSFKWTTAAQGAFENCKLLLCSAPVLKAPDLTRPFKLEIDASDVGMGAVLLQEDEGALDHPVSYFSKKFAKYQLHYSTVEKETLALVLAIQHFEVYLYPGSNPIVVYTDHNPLVFLSRMYNKNQRLMRWALLVQDYDLHIQHKKGTDNIVADSLSRAF